MIAHEDRPGDKRLVGYVTESVTGTVDSAGARAMLAERLPSYMVPAAVMVVDALPLTVDGKLDTGALPLPQYDDGDRFHAIEQVLAGIYIHLLGVEQVGADDSPWPAHSCRDRSSSSWTNRPPISTAPMSTTS